MDLWLLFKNWARRVHRAGSPTCEQWAGVMAQVPLGGYSSSPLPVWHVVCRWLKPRSLGSWELLASGVDGGGWSQARLPCIEQAEDRSPGGVGELEEMVSELQLEEAPGLERRVRGGSHVCWADLSMPLPSR